KSDQCICRPGDAACSASTPLRRIRGFQEGRISGSSQPQGAKMRQKSGPEKQPAEDAIRDIRRATRRHFSAEEKIRIVLEGLRGEESIAELCRREGIASSMYYGCPSAPSESRNGGAACYRPRYTR